MTDQSQPPLLRVVTYNVHSCVGCDGRRSEKRIAEVIGSLGADIVGLQELDLNRKRSAGVDQAALIAAELGWEKVFYPAMKHGDEHYGDAIITRFPFQVRKADELPCPSPWYCRESRGAIWIEAATLAGPVHVLNTHLGLGWRERSRQAVMLLGSDWIGAAPVGAPLILLGDFNSTPRSRAITLLLSKLRRVSQRTRETGSLATFPTGNSLLAVDHIFVNERFEAERLWVERSSLARVASDHYPLCADLRMNPPVTSEADR